MAVFHVSDFLVKSKIKRGIDTMEVILINGEVPIVMFHALGGQRTPYFWRELIFPDNAREICSIIIID